MTATPFPRPRRSFSKSMAPHERRAAGAYPYFKLAVWDERALCFRDGKAAHKTSAEARAAASKPGRYRISTVTETGRVDGAEFLVEGERKQVEQP